MIKLPLLLVDHVCHELYTTKVEILEQTFLLLVEEVLITLPKKLSSLHEARTTINKQVP